MSETRRLAAIDIGTVTTRLLVADVSDERRRRGRAQHRHHAPRRGPHRHRPAVARGDRPRARRGRRLRRAPSPTSASSASRAVATSASRDAENGGELVAALAALRHHAAHHRRRGRGAAVVPRRDVVGDGRGPARRRRGRRLDRADLRLVRGRRRRRRAPATSRRCARSTSARGASPSCSCTPTRPRARELDEARAYIAGALRPFFDALRTKPRAMVVARGDGDDASRRSTWSSPSTTRSACTSSCLTGRGSATCSRCWRRCRSSAGGEVVGLHPERARRSSWPARSSSRRCSRSRGWTRRS